MNDFTKNCKNICAILLARTESAIFIKNYFNSKNISYKHFEVGHFKDYNAKTYIKYRLEKSKITISNIVDICINEQFHEIKRIFGEDVDAFLGYAPVLDALAASYDDQKNTLTLLKNTSSGENNCILMRKILEDLLKREQEKFKKALKIKIPKCDEYFNTTVLYQNKEQLFRIFGMLLFNDSELFIDVDESVPLEYREEYLEVVNTQLPQHPFIFAKEINNTINYVFTGAAFRDFIMAYSLANEELCDFVDDYLSENYKYCPSQMLIEFYELFSNCTIKGKDIPLIYSSFKAHAHLGDRVLLQINGDNEECYVTFELIREEKTILSSELKLLDIKEGIYLNQLSNCFIDIEGKVCIGNIAGEARINNSIINCDEIIWGSEQVLIEVYEPGECILITNKFTCISNTIPRFEIKADNKQKLKISSSNLKNYYKLITYKCNNIFQIDDDKFESFSNVIRRIFGSLRSHSKDTPARKIDFINNRIVGESPRKNMILQFLLSEHLLYTDEQDWLYKLDKSKLSKYSIIWNDIREGNVESLKKLYDQYKISSENNLYLEKNNN